MLVVYFWSNGNLSQLQVPTSRAETIIGWSAGTVFLLPAIVSEGTGLHIPEA